MSTWVQGRACVWGIRTTHSVLLVIVLTWWLGACSSSVNVGAGSSGARSNGQVGGVPGGAGQAGEEDVLVRFINLSDVDVDTQFHATNESLQDPPNDLIDPRFAVQTELGVFGSGVLLTDVTGEFSVDEITFPCTETTVLGTAGGEYLDPDQGTPLTTGQSRVVQAGINFDCGNTIIFTFTGSDGQYSTEPPFVDFSD